MIGSQITDNGDGTYNVDVPSDGSSLDTSAWSNSLRDFGPKIHERGDFYTKFLFRKIRVMVSNWQTMQSNEKIC